MPFLARNIGQEVASASKSVTARDVLAYAAGIGEASDRYLDDARAGGIYAVPFYNVSLEWQLVVANRQSPDTGLTPEEVRSNVHAKQDTVFHRPIRPGDHTLTRGRWVEARTVNAGSLSVMELTTTREPSGEPLATTWSTGIYRGTALDGDPVSLGGPPPLPINPASAFPDGATEVDVFIPRHMPHSYSECADIWNPVHTEREVALAAGLPDIILHGTATWALAGKEILHAYVDGDGAALKRFCGRFVGMVIPGTTITIRHVRDPEVAGVVRYEVLTQDGARAIDQGVAVLG
ncbi:MAG: MaoC family dehydratase N-terminal domain-containing protein [Rhodospirillales bacterium]|nr:MaoC family dehydratase N-terminal domain-containing protein [Rhodospirillales bacterium]